MLDISTDIWWKFGVDFIPTPPDEDVGKKNSAGATTSSLSDLLNIAKTHGRGLRIQRLERFGGRMRGLWRSWRRRFPGRDVGINLYYSPPAQKMSSDKDDPPSDKDPVLTLDSQDDPPSDKDPVLTLDSHADDMDEFILQVGGRKLWQIDFSSVNGTEETAAGHGYGHGLANQTRFSGSGGTMLMRNPGDSVLDELRRVVRERERKRANSTIMMVQEVVRPNGALFSSKQLPGDLSSARNGPDFRSMAGPNLDWFEIFLFHGERTTSYN